LTLARSAAAAIWSASPSAYRPGASEVAFFIVASGPAARQTRTR
jgi:hypothetical protein